MSPNVQRKYMLKFQRNIQSSSLGIILWLVTGQEIMSVDHNDVESLLAAVLSV